MHAHCFVAGNDHVKPDEFEAALTASGYAARPDWQRTNMLASIGLVSIPCMHPGRKA